MSYFYKTDEVEKNPAGADYSLTEGAWARESILLIELLSKVVYGKVRRRHAPGVVR